MKNVLLTVFIASTCLWLCSCEPAVWQGVAAGLMGVNTNRYSYGYSSGYSTSSNAYTTSYPTGSSYSSGSSSSSSSSTTTRTASSSQPCHLCHGTKKCWTCNGTRRVQNGYGVKGYHECPNCTDGWCSHCHGTGKK